MTHADPKTEAAVIGALLDAGGPLLPEAAHHLLAASGLRAGDFTHPALRACFESIETLAARKTTTGPLQVWGLAQVIPAVEKLGHEKLASMQASNALDDAGLRQAAESLRRLRLLRELTGFLQAQAGAAADKGADPTHVAKSLGDFLSGFTANVEADETADKDLFEILDDWDAAVRGERLPIMPTGIASLDEEIGGWVCNLNVVGGLPSVGKSAVIGEIIRNQLAAGFKLGLFGLEDGTRWLSERHLARAMNIPVRDVGRVRLHEYQQAELQERAGKLAQLTRNLVKHSRAGIDPSTLIAKCKHWILNLGVKAIYIDHGGEVSHESGAAKDRHDLAVASTYRQLRDLAVNYRVPIVVLCHFNREADRSGRPNRSSFAETAYIERMARLALGLWEVPDRRDQLRVTVLKATNGRRDQTVWLQRSAESGLVESLGGGLVDEAAEARAQSEQRPGRGLRAGKRTFGEEA